MHYFTNNLLKAWLFKMVFQSNSYIALKQDRTEKVTNGILNVNSHSYNTRAILRMCFRRIFTAP